jgi:MFS family permease
MREAATGRVFQLVLLTLAAASSSYVRSMLGPLQEAMRGSLALSDNEVALLQGMALAVPLATISVPMGLLVDRTRRKRILLASFVLALVAAVLSAWATNFNQLLLARCLMGLAIPGIVIAAYSMVADLYSPAARGRATMVMGIGELGGAPLAFALGGALLSWVESTSGHGILDTHRGDWSAALLWMCVTLVPVLLSMLLLREPARTERPAHRAPLSTVLPQLWRHRAVVVPLQFGRAALFLADGAVYVWGAPLLTRRFHLAADRVGAILGAILLTSALLGPTLGGPLADWCQRHGGPRRALKVLSLVAAASVPIGLFPLLPNVTEVGVVLTTFLTLGWVIAAAALALTLTAIPSELRATNLGISAVVGSLFFVGLAPLTVSLIAAALGGESEIGYGLAIVCVATSTTNAVLFGYSARRLPDEATPAPQDGANASRTIST